MQATLSAEECREIARMVADEIAAMNLLASVPEPRPPLGVDGFCRWYYELPEGAQPTVAQRTTVAQMCREGKVAAFKVGRKWFIDMDETIGKGLGVSDAARRNSDAA